MGKVQFNIGSTIKNLKKAQMNVDGVIKNVKKVQANIDGVIKTIWQSAYMLYSLGIQYISFQTRQDIPGISTISYNADHVAVFAQVERKDGVNYSTRTDWATTLIDITKYKKIYVEWESSANFDNIESQAATLAVTAYPSGVVPMLASLYKSKTAFARVVESIDVSSLSGNVYIHVYSASGDKYSTANYQVKVYKLWLEE